MKKTIVEVKALCSDLDRIKNILQSRDARFIGLDHQIDTYFHTHHGRLKLREGTIERNLIHYDRGNERGPKQSNVLLFKVEPHSALKDILARSLGIRSVVDKQREIYFIENVKFHLDRVQSLGTFVEVEAIDTAGTLGLGELKAQCQLYVELFGIHEEDFISDSYGDMRPNSLERVSPVV